MNQATDVINSLGTATISALQASGVIGTQQPVNTTAVPNWTFMALVGLAVIGAVFLVPRL